MKKINENQLESNSDSVNKKLTSIKGQWLNATQNKSKKNIDDTPVEAEQLELIEPQINIPKTANVEVLSDTVINTKQPGNIITYLSTKYRLMTQPNINWKQRIRHIPLLGYIMSLMKALVKLPVMRHQLELNRDMIAVHEVSLQQQQQQLHQLQQLQNQVSQIDQMQKQLSLNHDTLKVVQATMSDRMTHLEKRLNRYDALDIGKRLMQIDQMQLERHNNSIKHMMRSHMEREKLIGSRIDKIENILLNSQEHSFSTDKLSSSVNNEAPVINSMQDDSFYAEFEAIFRGSRADIKERLKIYLPYVEGVPNSQENDKKLVIDIGCGRGEWLELMDENGMQGLGVDLNSKMVDICLEQGLYARCADAIQVLREQEPGSVRAVTGFHIIEHLPFEKLIALFDAALQALCEGGVIIFETPNPENLKVGACNFYFDPTHLNPIVPQVAEFMAKQRGFAHAEILRIHPYPEDHLLKGDSEVERLINKELFGPQDYAVIGRK